MKKLAILTLALFFLMKPFVKADEGMWLPMLIERLNYVDMKKMGLKLTAEEIYSVNNSSLKDAIVQFGNGCTGEIISKEGLILTNHHCGYGNIQSHSTVEFDYLKNGFWAYSKADELKNPGLTVSFLIRMEDVTSKVLAEVKKEMSEQDRAKAVSAAIKSISAEASKGTHYTATIRSFFEGNEYYLFIYEVYKDVRLVGAPPSSIGKYGADTDNWMWPRHTGDFAMFRVYTAPDGTPAEYSKDNIPMAPKHHLPVSIGGVKNGDFSMILGYPGSTDRYLTSYGINQSLEQIYPSRIKVRRKKLDILFADMEASDKVRIQYSSKYAGISNYWKNFIGMSRGLKRLKVADKKKQTELLLASWIEQFPSRKEVYGSIFPDFETGYNELKKYNIQRFYAIEAIFSGPEAIGFSRRFEALHKALGNDNPDQEQINKLIKGIRDNATKFFKDYNMPTDKKLWAEMLKMYYEDVPKEQHPLYLTSMVKKHKGDFYKFADAVYAKSIFVNQAKVDAFLINPTIKILDKDPVFVAMKAFFENYTNFQKLSEEATLKIERSRRLFIDALRQMKTDKIFYPDANFTMRLTYGNVKDYYPADAVHYNYYTTLDGVMEKEDPNNWEFVVPEKLKKLWKEKDFGQYGENGEMKVCFLTTHDITGGNSGSPVLNANGELIGLAFDGNWEAMSGDIAFEPELQRTINVDIRYVLFIIDKYAGAKNIIDELTLVK